MADPDLDVSVFINVLVDFARASGRFDAVQGHEPLTKPDSRITAGVWVNDLTPIQGSGLASSSMRVELIFRVYQNALMEPLDLIDPNAVAAVSAIFTAIGNDIDFSTALSGVSTYSVRGVDILGYAGQPLRARPGFMNLGGTIYRVFDIFVPIIVNDVFAQV